MLRTTIDYHTPIVDIWQKPTLDIKWFYTRQEYSLVTDYIIKQLETIRFDYLRYTSGIWHGIPHEQASIAWLDRPEQYTLPFQEFLKLIDFKVRQLTTLHGKCDNLYTTIYITSQHTIFELFPGISEYKLYKIVQFMDINRLET